MNKIDQIREKIKTLISASSDFTGVNVFDSLDTPIWEGSGIPGLNVLNGPEGAETAKQGPDGTYFRTLEILIEGAVKDSASPNGKINNLFGRVESLLNKNKTLDGLADDVEYDRMVTAVVSKGSSKLGVGNLFFTVRYYA